MKSARYAISEKTNIQLGTPRRFRQISLPREGDKVWGEDEGTRDDFWRLRNPSETLSCVALAKLNPCFDFAAISVYCAAFDLYQLYKLTGKGHRITIRFHVFLIHDTLIINGTPLTNHDDMVKDDDGIQSARDIKSLLQQMKAVMKTSKHGVCVATTEKHLPDTMDTWEPEFDIKHLDEQEVPGHLPVQKQYVSDQFIQKFWVDNSSKDSNSENN